MALDTTVGGTAAESYVTVAEFQAYAAKMGWTLTSATSPEDAKYEQDLRRATIYIDGRYTWTGIKAADGQRLDWPRFLDEEDKETEYFDTATIPQDIKDAQCEVAYLINQGTDPLATVTTGAIKRQKSKAGPVEVETEYIGSSVLARYLAVDYIVQEWTTGGVGGQRRMVRA